MVAGAVEANLHDLLEVPRGLAFGHHLAFPGIVIMDPARGGHEVQGLPVQFHHHQDRGGGGLLDDRGHSPAFGQRQPVRQVQPFLSQDVLLRKKTIA